MNASFQKGAEDACSAEPIAIVGIGCVYPKAQDLTQFWRNILDKVDAVSEPPDDWDSQLFFDTESTENDRIYTNRGGFLGQLARFDPLRHGVMPNSVDGGEPDQFLALEVAADAVEDAGFEQRPVAGDRVSVILGRGTYINRGFANVVQHGVMVDRFIDILRKLHPDTSDQEASELKSELKSSLPPFNSEMAAALVPNLVTGRISNRLDFRGANYIIDAACASSLIALERGLADLRSGACDMALVGGVHASTPAPIFQIFCQLGALSRKGSIRPFSADADGTLLAEGVGILCLKRLSDAEAAGNRIYALVRSVGVASDGKGMSILAPRLEGERLAIQRAYEAANIDPRTVGLIEAHGTATKVGDATEIEAISKEFGKTQSPCALGSVKSMIGHCLPAAGSAGLIKAAMALHHRILPPTLVDTSNPDLGIEETNFYLNTEARPWFHGTTAPRRAGVNAFGFGGINAHAVLEEYNGSAPAPQPVVTRDSELLVFDAQTPADALAVLDSVSEKIALSTGLSAAAREINAGLGNGRCRFAVVAQDTAGAIQNLELIRKGLEKGRVRLRDRRGAYFSTEPLAETGKVAFLFPGEGSQYRGMLQPLMMHFPEMRRWFDLVDGAYVGDAGRRLPSEVFFPTKTDAAIEDDLWRMDVGPEAIFAANMAVSALLGRIGLRADMLVGHSTGEYAALNAAGVTSRAVTAELQCDIRELNKVFASADAAGEIADGTLFTIGPVDVSLLRSRIAERDDVFLGMNNCPGQQILTATSEQGAAWIRKLSSDLGGYCEPLPFSRAYHCPAFRAFSERVAVFLNGVGFASPQIPVYSCLTAEPFPDDPATIRQLSADQWSGEVRFSQTVSRMYDDGARIFVECGPRNNLTSFANDILRKKKHLAVAVDTTARQGLEQLHHMAGQLLVEGVALDMAAVCAPEPEPRGSTAGQPLKMGLQPMALSDKPRPKKTPKPVSQHPDLPDANGETPPENTLVSGYFKTMDKILEAEHQVMSAFLRAGGRPMVAPETALPAANPDRFPMLAEHSVAPDRQSLSGRLEVSHAIAPYLKDHSFGRTISTSDPARHGLSVVPLTFTMEALAEAAAALRPELVVVGMREIRGSSWISVEMSQNVVLEVTAEIISEGETTVIHTRLRNADGPTIRPVIAEGDIELAATRPTAPAAPAFTPGNAQAASWSLEDVYGRIMFHGPRLQAVESMTLADPEVAEGSLVGLPHDRLFATDPNPQFETDAITLDAVGQLVGVWSADQLSQAFHIFPFRVERVEIFRDNLAKGERAKCRCEIALVGVDEMRSDIVLVTKDGRIQCRITGWWDKRFDLPDKFFAARLDPARNLLSTAVEAGDALPDLSLVVTECLGNDLLDGSGGIWAGVLGGLVLSQSEAAQWRQLGSEPERFDWIRERVAAKDAVRVWRDTELCPADLTLATTAEGQTVLADGWPADWGAAPVLSAAQTGERAVSVAANADRYSAVGVAVATASQNGGQNEDVLLLGQGELDQLVQDDRHKRRVGTWLVLAKQAAAKASGVPTKEAMQRYTGVEIDLEHRFVALRDETIGTTVNAQLLEDTTQDIVIGVVAHARNLQD